MAHVLVIDDDRSLLRALRVGLTAYGHRVDTARNGDEGLQQMTTLTSDVIILDLGLPDIDGIDLCRQMRQSTDVPIIVLSASGLEHRKVAALNEGANDYVTKPFGMAELEARIRSVMRTRVSPPMKVAPSITIGALVVDAQGHTATWKGERLTLTSKEFSLLLYLAHNLGKVCTRQTILRHVWGNAYGDEGDYVRVYIYRLRRKLKDSDASFIRTQPGVGYFLQDPTA